MMFYFSLYERTGLDAAGPGFLDNRGLNKSCAQFVQVLHTNFDLGSSKLLGDVDFYANNKSIFQPGCPFKQCGHSKAIFYYYASLLPQYEFIGFDCERQDAKHTATFSRFGLFNNGDELGEFCFNTTACFPYMATEIGSSTESGLTDTTISSSSIYTEMITTKNTIENTELITSAIQSSFRRTKKHKYRTKNG